jgi:hypothetical protein
MHTRLGTLSVPHSYALSERLGREGNASGASVGREPGALHRLRFRNFRLEQMETVDGDDGQQQEPHAD